MRKLTDMALNVESFEEYYMKATDKHIIVFTMAYLVTKWIKNRILDKNNTGFLKYSLYSSHI